MIRKIRMITFVVFVLYGLSDYSSAQMDSLQIDGPHEVAVGQLVRLRAELEPNESPFWIVLQPTDLDYEQVNDGTQLIFAANCSRRETITILLLAQSVANDRIVTRQLRRTITVKDKGSTPDDELDDDDEPAPIPNLDLTKSPLYSAVQFAWKKIKSELARTKTNEVASNFETIAGACETGAIKEIPGIWNGLSSSNRSTLGDQTSQWKPVGLAMQQGFQQLKLSSVEEHAFHLKAIAAALRSVQ